jgi:hypothetical protein
MLYFPNTRVAVSSELPIAAGAVFTAEGQAMVSDNTGGIFGAKPSTAAAGENFLGVAVSQQIALTSFPKVEEVVQPLTDIITLARTPSVGTVFVYNVTTGAALASPANYTIAGAVITMAAATRGNVIRIVYKFAPTVIEARSIMGDIYPGGAPGLSIGQVGVQRSGSIFTTEFDSAVNWNVANPVVKTGANGQFTIGGTGTTVDCAVIQLPSTSLPYLGLLLK